MTVKKSIEDIILPQDVWNEYHYEGHTVKPLPPDYFGLVSNGALVVAYNNEPDGQRPTKRVGFLHGITITRGKTIFGVAVPLATAEGLTTMWYDEIEVVRVFPQAIHRDGTVFLMTGIVEEEDGSISVKGEKVSESGTVTFPEKDIALMSTIQFGFQYATKGVEP